MADNESKVSVEAEISVDTSKANSGLDKTGKTLDTLLKSVGGLSSEMDSLVKKFVELQKVAGKALSSMSKDEISKATGLLAKAEQIRGRGNSGGKKRKKDGHSKKNNSSNAQANKIAKSTDDVGDSVSDMTELAGDIAKSFESMGDSIQSLAGTVKSLEKKVSSMDIRAKEADAKALNASSRAKSVDIRDKELEIKGLNASTRKKKVEQEAPLVEEKVKTEVTKQVLNKARAGRINEDHRYKAGWYGGIASGVGGAISRSRARSGFAGFMARVGTGVGQKNPGMNIMKGATLSGLGLNPLTLAFSTVGAGIAKLVEGLGQLSVESLQAYGEVEKLKTGLSVVFGSDTEANTMFEGIKDYSLESPFGVEQTTEMATLLKQSGVYGTELLDTMRMIGDTAGGNEEKFKRIANNYAQIASIGKASMLDMRQFAYAGIPIYKKVAEELGVSQSVLRQMISDGEVTAEVIEKVFKTMTSEGGEFYKSVEKGAKTLNARLVNLQDAMNMAKAGFGENMFKADIFTIGNDGNNEGTLGQLLGWVEDLARKADSWAELHNISRDVSSISKRERIVSDLEKLIARNELKGMDTSALESIRSEYVGMDTPESVRASMVRLYDATKIEYDKLNNANLEELNKRLNSLMSIDTKGIDKDLVKEIEEAIYDLAGEIQAVEDFRRGYGKYEMEDILSQSDIYKAETDATALATRVFESARKNALSASSLNTKAEESRQEYYNSEQGKEELRQKEIAQRKKDQEEFNRFRRIISDTGMMLDSLSVSASNFVELMKSGIIVPEEVQTVTRDALLADDDDTDKEKAAKAQAWDDMASRALQVKQYEAELPRELQLALGQVISSVTSIPNTEAGFKLLSKSLQELSEMQAFNNSDLAQQMVGYILTSSASVSDKMYDVALDGRGGGKDDSYPPLWKRITGAATGVDPNFITNAKDFYKLYGSQFEGRNISQGVISGMTASGKTAKEISSLIRLTKEKSMHGGQLIDWELTSKAMQEFVLSTHASAKELEAYSSAIGEQIGVYDKLKETIFTIGEDWEKMEGTDLAKQLHNAFSGIGESMLAVNAAGQTRELEVDDEGRFIFKDTQELLSAQDEFVRSLEETIKAIDSNTSALRAKQVDAADEQHFANILDESTKKMLQASVTKASADAYRATGKYSSDTLEGFLSGYIDAISGDSNLIQGIKEVDIDSLYKALDSSWSRYSGISAGMQTSATPEVIADMLADARYERESLAGEGATSLDDDGYNPRLSVVENFIRSAEEYIKASTDRAIVQTLPDKSIEDPSQRLIGQMEGMKSLESWLPAFMESDPSGVLNTYLQSGMLSDEAKNSMGAAQTIESTNKMLKLISDTNAAIEKENGLRKRWNNTVLVNKGTKGSLTHDRQMEERRQQLLETDFSGASEALRNVIENELTGALDFDPQTIVNPISESMRIAVQELIVNNPDMTMEEAQETVLANREIATKSISKWDFSARAQNAIERYAENPSGEGNAAKMAGGVFAQAGMNKLAGTDGGDFIQGTAMGGPLVGLLTMLAGAITRVLEPIQWFGYSANAATNLLKGFSDILKVLMVPALVTSRLFELLGMGIQKLLSWIPGWDEMVEEIDEMGNTWAGLNDEQQKELELLRALNEQLGNTRKAFIEAEEYYLKEKMHQNATWAIEAQGLYGGGAVTNVNDMILTPHGNFSTAPDDYILAMKDPTSLMGDRDVGSGYVQVKFIVNNNASDLVDAQASEQTGDDGTKELIVTISRAIAGDYASGRNGWDSAITGRKVREQGRRVTR